MLIITRMTPYNKPSHVSAPALPKLRPIFHKWIAVQRRYRKEMEFDDRAWAYGERPCIGFLSAAAWQSGAVTLEEWRTDKGSRRDSRYGRCDLYVYYKDRQYLMEAKHVRVRALASLKKQKARIRAKLKEARRDARNLQHNSDQNRLAVVFVVPYFTPNDRKADGTTKSFSDWLKQVAPSYRKFKARAWLCADETEIEKEQPSKHDYFPGILLLVY